MSEKEGEIWRRLFSINRLNLVRELIVEEVNEHQHFIAFWRSLSFRMRCRIDQSKYGGLAIR